VIYYKTAEEIELMREAALVVSRTLGVIAEAIQPGVTPLQLDKLAETVIRDLGAEPGFLGLYDYKYTLCTSVNEQVVHGIPDNRPLQEGDIISVDCGSYMHGFYGDHAFTFAVGEIKPEVKRLLQVTRECVERGGAQMLAGNRIGDIAYTIQQHAEKNGYGVVRELVGHGLGKKLHEAPEVPNYGKRGSGPKLQNGMVLAIEPMINMGTRNIRQLKDGWTIVTADGKPSAHFEHNVAMVDGKPEFLSTYKFIDEVLEKQNA
jgi:methionyl aminopeptidase